MTASKAMRAVRDHATRSEGAAAAPGGGGSMQQGPRDSIASGDSSEASESGVVNSPLVDKQRRPSGARAALCACRFPVYGAQHVWRRHVLLQA